MARYLVVVSHWDDSTGVEIELTDEQRDAVVQLAWDLTQAADRPSQPDMAVYPVDAPATADALEPATGALAAT